MVTIAPSLLAADFADLRGQIALAEKGGADWIHLDVMDGHFVPNITIGPPVIRSLRRYTSLPFDVHLMIQNPDLYLEDFRSAGADSITVHYETCPHLHRTVQKIRSIGARAGVCINPATPETLLSGILADADMILVMSVNPGFGGQTFIPSSVEKIRRTSRAGFTVPGAFVPTNRFRIVGLLVPTGTGSWMLKPRSGLDIQKF